MISLRLLLALAGIGTAQTLDSPNPAKVWLDDTCEGGSSTAQKCAVNALQHEARFESKAESKIIVPPKWIPAVNWVITVGLAPLNWLFEKYFPLPDQSVSWHGPPRPSPWPNAEMLWGGPAVDYGSRKFTIKSVPTDGIEKHMKYADANSGAPESIQGIWWMDEAGFSSVAKTMNPPFNMPGSWEVLQSFGGGSGAWWDAESRCATGTAYGGGRSFEKNGGGRTQQANFDSFNLTVTYCLNEAGDQIANYVKTTSGILGIFDSSAFLNHITGETNAGNGYHWENTGFKDTTFYKADYGWQVVTTALQGIAPGLMSKKYFPLLQVVDGNGVRTKYYDEYLAYMATKKNGNFSILPVLA